MLLDGLTVFENVCIPKVIKDEPYRSMEKKAKTLLNLFGIDDIGHKYPVEISGGQKQRTAVARALMNDPLMILADEHLPVEVLEQATNGHRRIRIRRPCLWLRLRRLCRRGGGGWHHRRLKSDIPLSIV